MRLARLVLPLGAIALLSTVFLFSRSIDPQRAVELADIDVAELAREPRIGAARFAAVTTDDTAMTVSAESVRAGDDFQNNTPLLNLENPAGVLTFASERLVEFRGEVGRIDQAADIIRLDGNVRLETSDGYIAQMPELQAALSKTHITGLGGITAEGPPGEISADFVELTTSPTTSAGYLLAFRGNVRVLYVPEE
jgi:lipopolysaccharide export system protein LptC